MRGFSKLRVENLGAVIKDAARPVLFERRNNKSENRPPFVRVVHLLTDQKNHNRITVSGYDDAAGTSPKN
jgi:hypothetical protein